MLDISKKSQTFFVGFTAAFIGFTAIAATCDECIRIQNGIQKEQKIRESYIQLKSKNEAYLTKPVVSASAAIKVRSNIMLLGIKIETQDNKIEALNNEIKKQGNCSDCPVQEKANG